MTMHTYFSGQGYNEGENCYKTLIVNTLELKAKKIWKIEEFLFVTHPPHTQSICNLKLYFIITSESILKLKLVLILNFQNK